MTDTEARIGRFRETLTSNLLSKGDFIDWDTIDRAGVTAARGVEFLQNFVDAGDYSREALHKLLDEAPATYSIILNLIAFNGTGAQVEKWGLPSAVSDSPNRTSWIADQLLHIGLARLFADRPSVKAMVRVAEVYKDSFRRRHRSGKTLEERVSQLAHAALRAARELGPDEKFLFSMGALPDMALRRSLDYVVAIGKRPIVGIATVFQNQSGGRQQRDLALTYPTLQQRLSEHNMSLVLIADGQGLKEASDRSIEALFDGVRYPMNLFQAESGDLTTALLESSQKEISPTVDQEAISRLISEALRSKEEAVAADLPLSIGQARLALARYVETRKALALTLSAEGERLAWSNAPLVRAARLLKMFFSAPAALKLFADILGLELVAQAMAAGDAKATLRAPAVQPFAEHMFVSANAASLNSDITRGIGRASIEAAPASPVAIYLTENALSEASLVPHRKQQVFLPTNVIVLSPRELELMAMDRLPLQRFVKAILVQSDLTKVSPFVVSNATPERMFYGRESEAATILSTVTTNSVAILGGRRMGKTSLIRKVEAELKEARFQPFFADCQTVRTWEDFASLAGRKWDVSLPTHFRPENLEELVAQLARRGEGPVVVILDEIDQLLQWDREHGDQSVPEAFFRACRSISQEGLAQFVFSGERSVATRIWDPYSPHWNFCRPLPLAQLSRDAAMALLSEPLRAMNIAISDIEAFYDEAWRRTSGHPQIVQTLGDRLVGLLDGREDRSDLQLSADDVITVTDTYDFADHYLTTYWGQATPLEREISEIISNLELDQAGLFATLSKMRPEASEETVGSAVRMLQLYGVLADNDGRLGLRAEWFPSALTHFGTLSQT